MKRTWSGAVLAWLLLSNAFATSAELDASFGQGCFVATLSLGPGWARPGEEKILTLTPDVQKSYVPFRMSRAIKLVSTAEGTNTLFAGELFLGLRGEVNSVVEGQLGVTVGGSSQVKLRGTIFEDTNPAFNNFDYSYSLSSSRIALKTKFLYDTGIYNLFPYLSGNIGLSLNHASGFTIHTKLFQEVTAPVFSNNKETELSYGFGVGLETAVDPNWRVALGYEFVDWGMSALGRALGEPVREKGIRLTHMRAHEVLISLSFVA